VWPQYKDKGYWKDQRNPYDGKIEVLHPQLQQLARTYLQRCEEAGLKVRITQTIRSQEYQDHLYMKGRNPDKVMINMDTGFIKRPPGKVADDPAVDGTYHGGATVSGAPYPMSPHCWGTAFDMCRNDGQGAFNDKGGWFSGPGKIGAAIPGLTWGGNWTSYPDRPHYELSDPKFNWKTLQAQYGSPAKFMESYGGVAIGGSPMAIKLRKVFSGIKFGDHLYREAMECATDSGHKCGFKTVDYLLALIYNKLIDRVGDEVVIDSGSRCEKINASDIKGISGSYHLVGQAMDIYHNIMTANELAAAVKELFGSGVNCVVLDADRIHIDVRSPNVDKKQIPVGAFSRADFTCSCGCGLDSVDYSIVRTLSAIREEIARPMQIVPTKKCAVGRNAIGMYADFTVGKIPGKGFLAKGEPAMSADEIIGQFGGKFASVAKMEKVSDLVVRIIAI